MSYMDQRFCWSIFYLEKREQLRKAKAESGYTKDKQDNTYGSSTAKAKTCIAASVAFVAHRPVAGHDACCKQAANDGK